MSKIVFIEWRVLKLRILTLEMPEKTYRYKWNHHYDKRDGWKEKKLKRKKGRIDYSRKRQKVKEGNITWYRTLLCIALWLPYHSCLWFFFLFARARLKYRGSRYDNSGQRYLMSRIWCLKYKFFFSLLRRKNAVKNKKKLYFVLPGLTLVSHCIVRVLLLMVKLPLKKYSFLS